MRNEIVVAKGDEVILLAITLGLELVVDRSKREALPLLVQQTRILSAAIMSTELVQLVVVVECQPCAIFSRLHVGIDNATAGNLSIEDVVLVSLDVSCL